MEWSLAGLQLPVILRPPVRLTDEEFLAFAQRNEPCRVERNAEGELVVMTPVGNEGGRREIMVASELLLWAEQDGRGEANGPNAGFNLPDGSTLSPDASWTELSRLAAFTATERERYLAICPDFIIEVRSISDSLAMVEAKMRTWMANGARLAWMIDPYGATAAIYRPGCPPEILDRPDSLEGETPVAGFRLTMGRLWARL